MKKLLFTLFMIAAHLSASDEVFTNKEGIANEGYDVVAYFSLNSSASAKKGNSEFSTDHADVTYYFLNEENKQKFLENPRSFLPQYGGFCAYAVATSESKVKIDPNSWTIDNGKLYLNYNKNVREKWLENKQKYIEDADRIWPKIKYTPFKRGWIY